MGGFTKQVADRASGFRKKDLGGKIGGLFTSASALGFAADSIKKSKNTATAKRKEADRQRRSAFDKQISKQQEGTQEIQSLFNDLSDPTATAGQTQEALAKIKNIDVSKFTGQAQKDVQKLRGIANTVGETDIAKSLLSRQQAAETGRLEQIGESAATQRAQQLSQLGQFGGAGAGARERLALSSGANALREQQRERRAGAFSRLGIQAQDEQRKLALSQALPGQELAIGQQSLASQKAQAQSLFQQAQANQKARQFDVASSQQAQQFKVGGLANQKRAALEQQGKIFASGQLADVLASQRKKSIFEDPAGASGKILDPGNFLGL